MVATPLAAGVTMAGEQGRGLGSWLARVEFWCVCAWGIGRLGRSVLDVWGFQDGCYVIEAKGEGRFTCFVGERKSWRWVNWFLCKAFDQDYQRSLFASTSLHQSTGGHLRMSDQVCYPFRNGFSSFNSPALVVARSHVHPIDTQLSHTSSFKSFGIVLVHLLSQRHWLADQFFHDGAEWLSLGNGVGIILFRSVPGLDVEFSCELLFLVHRDTRVRA